MVYDLDINILDIYTISIIRHLYIYITYTLNINTIEHTVIIFTFWTIKYIKVKFIFLELGFNDLVLAMELGWMLSHVNHLSCVNSWPIDRILEATGFRIGLQVLFFSHQTLYCCSPCKHVNMLNADDENSHSAFVYFCSFGCWDLKTQNMFR